MYKASNLSVQRDRFFILEQLSIAVEPGQALVIRGRNGCGKTTLLRTLAGLIQPEEGASFHLGETEYQTASPDYRRQLHYLGHQLGIKADLSCEENLSFAARLLGIIDADIQGILDQVGLKHLRWQMGRALSAGQRKRLALARLLAGQTRLWLLDEPYSNLDHQGVALVNELITQQLQHDAYVILTTHGSFQPEIPNLQLMEMTA